MLPPFLLFATVGLRTASDVGAELGKGQTLHRLCQAEVRLMDKTSLSAASQSDLLNGSYCVGYVNGYLANLNKTNGICTTGEPVGKVVRLYVEYMDRNPKLLAEDRSVGLTLALQEAYPCPVADKPRLSKPPTEHSST